MIIFDCDGTLIDTEYPYNKALSDALTHHGYAQYTVDHVNEFYTGRTYKDIMHDVESDIGKKLDDEFHDHCLKLCDEYILTYRKPIEGVVKTVRSLAKHHDVAVASNGFRDHVRDSIQFLELHDIFPDTHIFTKCDVARPKPFPDLFLHVATTMQHTPDNVIVIEDSVTGVTAGVAAGMHVIGFVGAARNKPRTTAHLKQAGAHIVLNEWTEIQDYIINK